MSWICENCSTSNDDSVDTCILCDAPRSADAKIGKVSASSHGKAARGRSASANWLAAAKVFGMLSPLPFAAIGIMAEFLLFKNRGKVLFLKRFVWATKNYNFNMQAFLIATAALGCLVAVLATVNNFYMKQVHREYSIHIATIPFCLSMLVCPSLNVFWLLAFEVILPFVIKRPKGIALPLVMNVFAVAALVVFPYVEAAIGVELYLA